MKIELFELNRLEADSALWKRIKVHVEWRIKVFRKQNDGDLGAEETARLRGKIAFAKELLGIEPAKEIDREAG